MTKIDPFTLRSLKTSVNRIVVGPYKEITKYFLKLLETTLLWKMKLA